VTARAAAVLLAIAAACSGARAPATSSREKDARAPHATTHRGLYVEDTPAIVADDAQLASLVQFARDHAIERIVFYRLGDVLATPALEDRLAAAIQTLRAAGVTTIGAPIAGAQRLDTLAEYDERHPDARFDLLVTELEYWNRCGGRARDVDPEEVRACFAPMEALLDAMRAAADASTARGAPVRVAAYLGDPTAGEVRRIAARVDHVLLQYAVRSPVDAHARDSLRRRLASLAAAGVEVWPILYARGEVDMSAWLATNDLDATEAAFRADLAATPDLANVTIGGFQYFTYDALRGGGE
jgi:hypothetical protein